LDSFTEEKQISTGESSKISDSTTRVIKKAFPKMLSAEKNNNNVKGSFLIQTVYTSKRFFPKCSLLRK